MLKDVMSSGHMAKSYSFPFMIPQSKKGMNI